MSRFAKGSFGCIGAWLVSLFVANVLPSAYSILGSFAIAGAMPFMLIVLWLAFAECGERLRDALQGWLWKVLLGVFVVIYSVLGHKWAGDILNEIFEVDARYFGVTQSVLTWLSLPFGLVYKAEHLSSAFGFVLVAGTVGLCGVFFVVAIGSMVFTESARWGSLFRWKWVLRVALVVVLAIAYTRQLTYLPREFKPAVEAFAVWADFNENHRCSDAWVKPSTKVAFLDGPMVLAVDDDARTPVVRTCSFSRMSHREGGA